MEKRTTGAIIREYRDIMDWTQAELALKAEVSTPTISLLESDKHKARKTTLSKIGKILRIPDNVLFGGSDALSDSSNEGESSISSSQGEFASRKNLEPVVSNDLKFPIGLNIGDFHVEIEPTATIKKDILRLIYWSLSTGIIKHDEIDALS